MERRDFLKKTGGALLATGAVMSAAGKVEAAMDKKFEISVAAWSWHKMMFSGEAKQIDQPRLVREAGATGLELVNQFFPSPMYRYLEDLNRAAKNEGVQILLIMCDGEGSMYASDHRARKQAVINHRKWLDIGAVLGCHSIRCNAGEGRAEPKEALQMAADSFSELCDYARLYNMNVIIENHGGLSSDYEWLSALMERVNVDNFGTLPDFGNFPNEDPEYKYKAVKALMPYAKAVSAKCYDFGPDGEETSIDFPRMMNIVLDAGYHGFVGVEYEGSRMGEMEGVKAAVELLKKIREA